MRLLIINNIKFMMKKEFVKLLTISILLLSLFRCEDNTIEEYTPIAPILKEVVMPLEADVIPGQAAILNGLGFSKEDKVFFENDEGVMEVGVISATDSYIEVIVPIEAGGEYSVIIERAGKQTTLGSKIKVPFIVPLTDVVLPVNSIVKNGEVNIVGEGFQEGDVAKLTASFYPQEAVFSIPVTLTNDGVRFFLPDGVYGVNNVLIIRENRQSN